MKPICQRCGAELEVGGGMPEDAPHAQTNYYVCPTHGAEYQTEPITPERIADGRKVLRRYANSARFDVSLLVSRLRESLDEIERLQAERRWIPVTERNPTEEGRYAVIYRDGKTKQRRKFVMDFDPVAGWRNVLPPAKIKMWLELPPDPEEAS